MLDFEDLVKYEGIFSYKNLSSNIQSLIVFIRYLVGLCEKCRHASDVRPLEGARAVSMAIIFLDVRRGSIVKLCKI